VALWKDVSKKYLPWLPHYGNSVSDFTDRYIGGGDLSWRLYTLIEKHFAGASVFAVTIAGFILVLLAIAIQSPWAH